MSTGFDFFELARKFSAAMSENRADDAAEMVRKAALPDLDYGDALSLCSMRRKLSAATAPPAVPLKVAVLGNYTLSQLAPLIDLFCFAGRVELEIKHGNYGSLTAEILDTGSWLYSFRPQIAFVASGWRDLRHLPPGPRQDRASVHSAIGSEVEHWSSLWNLLHQRLGCQIIQNNFDVRPWRAADNHDVRDPGSLSGYVSRLNIALADHAPAHVTIHDLDHLSSAYGRWAWGDEQYFHMAKVPCAPQCQVGYAHQVASLILAMQGRSRKCLVLDLDNTLWGGVIGDDGVGGIRLGQGDPQGEAYVAFQRYIKSLQGRGVLLAVCSKNNLTNAREPFDRHPEMVLRFDDISCFIANWDDKAANLRAIARKLNIGLNSLVFVDDNPAERALVRQYAPEVAVPELPDDPSQYIRAVDQHHYFQAVSISSEDLSRTDLYRGNARRDQALAGATNMEEYLRSLKMTARVEPVNELSLQRAVQLINKSNQFNLTTRRYTAAQVELIGKEPAWVTRTISLADRFGDNGLICVLLASADADSLSIDTWLMSCRVLNRGVEALALNELAAVALARGLRQLRGSFIPSERNQMVEHHYLNLGFKQTSKDENGATHWTLDLNGFSPRTNFIEVHRE
jgi:FkbH-like protein